MHSWIINGSLKKISNKILKILYSNTNAKSTYQNIWDTAQLVLKRQFAAMGINLEKAKRKKERT